MSAIKNIVESLLEVVRYEVKAADGGWRVYDNIKCDYTDGPVYTSEISAICASDNLETAYERKLNKILGN